jgi:hypothetical protein
MAWNNLVNPRAITSRRRGIATALVYGLSLTVRFTSGAGEETAAQAQAVQSAMTSVMINDGAQIFGPPKLALPIFFHGGSPVGSGGCRTACERPMPVSSILNCSSHP